ncbi:MAG: hypothetical protein JWQ77_2361 [Jatrophihabitans sp.]|nr:hypothetical protein [Jatrophihabitans sp.]
MTRKRVRMSAEEADASARRRLAAGAPKELARAAADRVQSTPEFDDLATSAAVSRVLRTAPWLTSPEFEAELTIAVELRRAYAALPLRDQGLMSLSDIMSGELHIAEVPPAPSRVNFRCPRGHTIALLEVALDQSWGPVLRGAKLSPQEYFGGRVTDDTKGVDQRVAVQRIKYLHGEVGQALRTFDVPRMDEVVRDMREVVEGRRYDPGTWDQAPPGDLVRLQCGDCKCRYSGVHRVATLLDLYAESRLLTGTVTLRS